MRTQIFISYRRNGGIEAASKLYELLSPQYEVFFDMKSLRNGRFDVAIENEIGDCSDFLLILSNNIFDRLEENDDWISQELKIALNKNKNIVPILLDGFSFPQTNNSYINSVKNYNGIMFGENDNFRDKLLSFLISNPKCVLPIGCNHDGYYLKQEGIEALKEICRNVCNQNHCDIRVSLDFPDAKESASFLLDEEERKDQMAINLMTQKLLLRRKQLCNKTERAIEYMLWDRSNLYTPCIRSELWKKPLSREAFDDKLGICHTYESVTYWLEVINVFLKEFTAEEYRENRYGNDHSFSKIYASYNKNDILSSCHLKNSVDFGFFSYIPKTECDLILGKSSPLMSSFTPQTLMSQIVPDFYYQVAEFLLEYGNVEFPSAKALVEELNDPDSSIYLLYSYKYSLD